MSARDITDCTPSFGPSRTSRKRPSAVICTRLLTPPITRNTWTAVRCSPKHTNIPAKTSKISGYAANISTPRMAPAVLKFSMSPTSTRKDFPNASSVRRSHRWVSAPASTRNMQPALHCRARSRSIRCASASPKMKSSGSISFTATFTSQTAKKDSSMCSSVHWSMEILTTISYRRAKPFASIRAAF